MTPTIDKTKGFTLTRNLKATPEEVWTAWTDAESAAKWLHPLGVTTPEESVSFDARVGGRYRYTMINDETGEEFPTGGVYLELNPYKHMVLTWGNPDDDPDEAPVITINLEPTGETTRMTFELRGFDAKKGDGYVYDGWEQALDHFENYVDERS